jgi:hypothetical protein
MVGGSTRKRETNCLQRHSIGYGVINTLQIKGNQDAYHTKKAICYMMMDKRME